MSAQAVASPSAAPKNLRESLPISFTVAVPSALADAAGTSVHVDASLDLFIAAWLAGFSEVSALPRTAGLVASGEHLHAALGTALGASPAKAAHFYVLCKRAHGDLSDVLSGC